MTEETTTEQLAEIEGQAESTPVTGYTPPEGWRVLQVGEVLRDGDLWVNHEGELWPTKRVGETVNDERYIRRIEPEPQPEPQPIQVREGRWRTRGGDIRNVTPTPQDHESFPAAYLWWDGFDTWRNDGRWWAAQETTSDLVEYLGPIEPDKTQELPEYTPPEGWRVLAVGERLRDGDVTVRRDGYQYPTERVGGWVGSNQRYIRPIEPQPEPEPEPQPEPESQPVQVREGRWKTRGGDIRNVTSRPAGDGRKDLFPWWDAAYGGTWTSGGRYYFGEESPLDLVEYLGPIEPQPVPEPVQVPGSGEQIRLLKECNARQAELIADLKYERSGAMERAEVSARSNRKLTEQIEELRSEVSYVQRLLGESRQRVTQLEELVASLRTINEAQEKAFTAAGKENTALRNQLAAVKAELASVAADRQRLLIELDAAQQVPADSPELRQLRADLEQATLGRDTYRDGYNRVLSDLETARETAKAEAVETITEWLQAFRGCNSPSLALLLLEALPSIMRSLTGLADDEDVD